MIHYNKTVDIERFTEVDGEKNYTPFISGLAVYIEPLEEDVALTFEWQGSYEVFRLMTSNTTLEIGDKVIEWSEVYKIRGKRVFDSLIGTHIECIIQSQYDD